MNIDIPEISTTDANKHTQFNELSLGLCTPFKKNEVLNPKKFVCDKESGRIMQERGESTSDRREPDLNHYTYPHDRTC
jgi:hypothetical protein